jgi:hypothetical protein
MINKKHLFIIFSACVLYFCANVVIAADAPPPLLIEITSSQTLSGTAGDFVSVAGTIKNTGTQTINNITTYLSLADNGTKLPVDLEDWSAEKELYIGSIDPQQTLPLNWKIHFVKAGTYSLIVVAEVAGNGTPQVSSITQFRVNPKINLNPANVLPVALGTPIVLIFVLFLLTYRRKLED